LIPTYKSNDQGKKWSLYISGLHDLVRDLIKCGDKIMAATTVGSSEISFLNEQKNKWEPSVNSGITQNNVNSLIEFGNLVLAGTHKGIYESQDYGLNWSEKINSGLQIEI
jgi:hypothetical protein